MTMTIQEPHAEKRFSHVPLYKSAFIGSAKTTVEQGPLRIADPPMNRFQQKSFKSDYPCYSEYRPFHRAG